MENFINSLRFKPYDYQVKYLNGIYEAKKTGQNHLITLPTGSGKSLALEYCANMGKTIYTVPIRALADEKKEELPQDYPNLRVLRDTGADFSNRKNFDYVKQDVIITTNERFLSILNNSIKEQVMQDVEYIVFDEIHSISDITRGSTLEWIIMLLKRYYPEITIVGLSATLPNYKEFAGWLNATYTYRTKRPIPLEFHYGDPISQTIYKQQVKRDYKFSQLLQFMMRFKEQFLVFLSSKPQIEAYAKQYAGYDKNATLEQIMKKGVAFHHADIDEDMKKTVLDEFKAGKLKAIFCSPTLAVGVNLPATNCVIFDMSYWNDIAFEFEPLPYDKLTQMFGRAGRVGYSDVGRVIILGDNDEIEIAKEHIEHPKNTNSQFGRVLVNKILNMIVNHIANTVDDIYNIIKESYLFYQNAHFDKSLIKKDIELLKKYYFIDGDNYFKPLKRGFLAVKMYISVYTLIDAVQTMLNTSVFDEYAILRIMLGNNDFLSSIRVNLKKRTDKSIVKNVNYRFNNSQSLMVSVYDKDNNRYVQKDKSYELKKAIGLIFKDDILPKTFKLYTSNSTINKLRQEASALVSRIGVVLKDDILTRTDDIEILKYLELSLKYGRLSKESISLFEMEGVGAKTIEKLMAFGITTKDKFLNTSPTMLKRIGIRNINSILKKQGQTSLTDF